jgi:hypothetical protein
MRILLLATAAFAVLITSSPQTVAYTDFKCVSDCTQQGYQYQYCTARCSYDQPNAGTPRPRQTDYKCVSDCTQRGYLYQYCVQQCSF